jgi:hypothetical protein
MQILKAFAGRRKSSYGTPGFSSETSLDSMMKHVSVPNDWRVCLLAAALPAAFFCQHNQAPTVTTSLVDLFSRELFSVTFFAPRTGEVGCRAYRPARVSDIRGVRAIRMCVSNCRCRCSP